MSETTNYDRQKQLINHIVMSLMDEDESLYYASTIDVCRLVHDKIQKGHLNQEESELLSHLSPQDIQIFLSYTSCC